MFQNGNEKKCVEFQNTGKMPIKANLVMQTGGKQWIIKTSQSIRESLTFSKGL